MKVLKSLFKAKPAPPVRPVSAPEFRRKLRKYAVFHIAVLVVGMGVYRSGFYSGLTEFHLAAFFSLLFMQIRVLCGKNDFTRVVSGRLLDIHPGLSKQGRWTYSIYLLLPLTLFPFGAYLSFARTRSRYFSLLVRRPKTNFVVVLLLILTPLFAVAAGFVSGKEVFSTGKLAHWTSPPTARYVISLSQEVRLLKEIKAEIKGNPKGNSPKWRMSQYSKVESPTVTALPLMMLLEAWQTRNRIGSNGRALASSERTQSALIFLEAQLELLKLFEKTGTRSLNLNAVSLLSPLGIVEATLLAIVDLNVRRTAFKDITERILDLFKYIEGNTKETVARARIKKLRKEFEQTRVFQARRKSQGL